MKKERSSDRKVMERLPERRDSSRAYKKEKSASLEILEVSSKAPASHRPSSSSRYSPPPQSSHRRSSRHSPPPPASHRPSNRHTPPPHALHRPPTSHHQYQSSISRHEQSPLRQQRVRSPSPQRHMRERSPSPARSNRMRDQLPLQNYDSCSPSPPPQSSHSRRAYSPSPPDAHSRRDYSSSHSLPSSKQSSNLDHRATQRHDPRDDTREATRRDPRDATRHDPREATRRDPREERPMRPDSRGNADSRYPTASSSSTRQKEHYHPDERGDISRSSNPEPKTYAEYKAMKNKT